MKDISPVIFRGQADGELRSQASFMRPMFFAGSYDHAKLYARHHEPVACVLRGNKALDLTQPDPRNEAHRAVVQALTDSFDNWADRISGEPRDAWSFLEAGDLYDYEGTGSGERWNALFRIVLDHADYDAVCVMDSTDGTDRQPSPVWVVTDAAKVRRASAGEELVARVRTRAWDETKRWLERNHAGVAERLSRLANIEPGYRLDRLHESVPAGMLGDLGDRSAPRRVYRGLPAQFDIRPGDWVALTPSYAQQHVRSADDTVHLLEQVHPEDVYWSGSDLSEFFYLPRAWQRDGVRAQQHLESLTDEQIRMLCDGEMNSIRRHAAPIARLRERIMGSFDERACGVYHGPSHWARVALHARAASRAEGIDPLIADLFALVHDSHRENEAQDPEHGPRAANFVEQERDGLFSFLGDDQVSALAHACRHHSDGMTEGDAYVRACWDGDRLDLGRVGVEPAPQLMCTDYGRRVDVIANAAC